MIERKVCGGVSTCKVIDFLASKAKINESDMDRALLWAKKEIAYLDILPERSIFEEFDDAPDMPDVHISMFAIDNDTAYYRICETKTGADAIAPNLKRTAGVYKRERVTYLFVENFADLREKYPERVARLLKNGAYLALLDSDPIRARAQFM